MSLPYLQPYLGLSNGLNTLHGAGAGGDPSAASGGWVELGRTTLGSTGSDIDVTGLADKRYLMLLSTGLQNGSINTLHRVGNGSIDTGSNYAQRNSLNGAADSTSVNSSYLSNDGRAGTDNRFAVSYIANYASKEKLMITHWAHQGGTGAANYPQRNEGVGKWTNTSNVIDQIRYMEAHTGTFAAGSELVVLGWDPLDSHANNFWEELATKTVSSGQFDAVTFTAKKYLWIQWELHNPSAGNHFFRFNSDAGANYSRRNSSNGGADATQYRNDLNQADPANPLFVNMFILNIANQEKLIICHINDSKTLGASAVPNRNEFIWKWVNTSSQINRLDDAGSATYDGTLKIWGAN